MAVQHITNLKEEQNLIIWRSRNVKNRVKGSMQTGCGEQKSQRDTVVVRDVVCRVCSKSFRRESDRKRHKYIDERRMFIWDQKGAVQCLKCQKWFKSKGRMAVHI